MPVAYSPVGEGGKLGAALPVKSEREVFDYLDEKYVAPADR